jgi:hypothetical protein
MALGGAEWPTRAVRTRRLSEGVLVEASIMARLLRWKVLTLDASLLLLPASARPGDDGGRDGIRSGATRGRLSDAIRHLDAAEQDLARMRDARPAGWP